MKATDVFISYKAEEFDEASWVKATLEHNGITCWMAPMSIPGGSSYALEIPQAIRNCKVFVLILSEKSQQSKWVPRELDQAINESKTVMPFMLENCTLKDDFNFYLTNVQRYAAYESKARAMEKMIREIKAILAVRSKETSDDPHEPAPDPTPEEKPTETETTPPAPKEKKSERKPKSPAPVADRMRKRKRMIVLAAVAAVVVGIICGAVVYSYASHVTIAGTSYSTSEKYLYFSNVELTEADVGKLSKFKKARSFTFSNCTIRCEDLSVLPTSDLQTLVMDNCHLTVKQIDSIDFSAMTQLITLDLSGNEGLSSLESISEVSDTLYTLKIDRTSVSNLHGISRFQRLMVFHADGNAIEDIAELGGCTDLKTVSLNENQIRTLKPLSACAKLTTLCVNENRLATLDGLASCIELEEIQAGSNQLTSLEGLENATLLRMVFLNDNQIADVSVLAKSAEHLQKVYLRNNRMMDIEAFRNCPALMYLNLDRNRISSLTPLADCKGLVGLSAEGNQIRSIEGLGEKPDLTYLDLANNQIVFSNEETLSFSSTGKVTLELSGNKIANLRLPEGVDYRYLGLHGNPLTQYESIYASKGACIVLDYRAEIDFASLAGAGYSKCMIVECPLGEQVSVREQLGKYAAEFIDPSACEGLIGQYIPEGVMGVSAYYH